MEGTIVYCGGNKFKYKAYVMEGNVVVKTIYGNNTDNLEERLCNEFDCGKITYQKGL